VYIEQLSLRNFRNYFEADLRPAPDGITLLRGDNGAGKTNLLEAVYYGGKLRSFRGAAVQALIFSGRDQAVVRATADREGRPLLVEIELNAHGRDRLRLNRQTVRRAEDLVSAVLVTVFSPDDIEIVKGNPQARRDFLDDLAASLYPKYPAALAEMERALHQRNALLKSMGGALRPAAASTLDVWDTKLADAGEQIVASRQEASSSLAPEVIAAYEVLATHRGGRGAPAQVGLTYQKSWGGALGAALSRARAEDVRRGVTTVGPQRDDLVLTIGGLAARVQASQGEQRSLALALRLGGHALVAVRRGTSPVLLLDDIFSELDPRRSAALAHCLPPGQTLLTTAGPVPPRLTIAKTFLVQEGRLEVAEDEVGDATSRHQSHPAEAG